MNQTNDGPRLDLTGFNLLAFDELVERMHDQQQQQDILMTRAGALMDRCSRLMDRLETALDRQA